MYLKVVYRPAYGCKRYFPLNDNAKKILKLFKRKCFSQTEIEVFKVCGADILVVSDNIPDFALENHV